MDATDKQIAYIIALWNRIHNRSVTYLSQTDLPLTQRERRGGMTKAEASALISELKAQL